MIVYCYRNLGRRGVVWSVKNTATGLVVDRSSTVYLGNCQLKVSQRGRDRVLLERVKNVHAGVKGERIDSVPEGNWRRVEYNPYLYNSFVYSDSKQAVTTARYVKLTVTGCYILEE